MYRQAQCAHPVQVIKDTASSAARISSAGKVRMRHCIHFLYESSKYRSVYDMQTQVAAAADAEGPVKVKALPLALGQQMAQQWRQGEAAYLQGLSRVFAHLRTERAVYPGHYAAVRNVYLLYLQRPAQDKQDKVCAVQWEAVAGANKCLPCL